MATEKFWKQIEKVSPAFVGEKYDEAKKNGCGLLVIGESHYLPKDSAFDVTTWYDADLLKDLTPAERAYVNTEAVVKDAIANLSNGEKQNRAYTFFREGFKQINACGPKLANYADVAKYVVCYNFFLRPANETGGSIRQTLTDTDIKVANENFRKMIEKYKPAGILFISSLAAENCDTTGLNIPVASAPHPACAHWNTPCAAYGNRPGREVVGDAMKGMDWSWAK